MSFMFGTGCMFSMLCFDGINKCSDWWSTKPINMTKGSLFHLNESVTGVRYMMRCMSLRQRWDTSAYLQSGVTPSFWRSWYSICLFQSSWRNTSRRWGRQVTTQWLFWWDWAAEFFLQQQRPFFQSHWSRSHLPIRNSRLLEKRKHITRERMVRGFFANRLDGLKHHCAYAKWNSHCHCANIALMFGHRTSTMHRGRHSKKKGRTSTKLSEAWPVIRICAKIVTTNSMFSPCLH